MKCWLFCAFMYFGNKSRRREKPNSASMVTQGRETCANMQAPLLSGESFRGKNGNRLAIVQNCVLTLAHPCRCPYPAGVYQGDGSERKVNLDMVLGLNETVLKALDEQVKSTAYERSVEWFGGKQLSHEQIEARYLPMARCREGDLPRLRTKINLDTLRCFNEKRERIPTPDNFTGLHVRPMLQLQTIWFMSGAAQFGCTVHCTDLMISDVQCAAEAECPF